MSSLFAAAAVGIPAAALLTPRAAGADAPGPGVPEAKPNAPRSDAQPRPRTGGLKASLTPGDRAMNRRCINKTLNEAPTGKTWNWKNPQTGNGGAVTPTSPPMRHAGQLCRNFTETVTLKDGRTETVSGRACRKRDGSWDIAA